MSTYVLVHGAWGGSYGWTKFANLLRSDGHDVFTPSLTGQGERNHLGGPNVSLTTHITDVENLIKYEDLTNFVLVGHSYGGMVVTGVADHLYDQITDLVYLDAFLPNDGESCFDLGGAGGVERARIEDGWKVMPMGPQPTGAESPEIAARLRKLSPQPIETLQEKVRLSKPLEERAFTLTYVKAAVDTFPERPHERILGRRSSHKGRPALALLRTALRPRHPRRNAQRAAGYPL